MIRMTDKELGSSSEFILANRSILRQENILPRCKKVGDELKGYTPGKPSFYQMKTESLRSIFRTTKRFKSKDSVGMMVSGIEKKCPSLSIYSNSKEIMNPTSQFKFLVAESPFIL